MESRSLDNKRPLYGNTERKWRKRAEISTFSKMGFFFTDHDPDLHSDSNSIKEITSIYGA